MGHPAHFVFENPPGKNSFENKMQRASQGLGDAVVVLVAKPKNSRNTRMHNTNETGGRHDGENCLPAIGAAHANEVLAADSANHGIIFGR